MEFGEGKHQRAVCNLDVSDASISGGLLENTSLTSFLEIEPARDSHTFGVLGVDINCKQS